MQKSCFIALLALLGLGNAGPAFAQSPRVTIPDAAPFSDKMPVLKSYLLPSLPRMRSFQRSPLPLLPVQPLPQLPAQPLPFRDSVRILPPDHMPCLVPDLTRVEKMPVRKLRNTHPRDPMPNALAGPVNKTPVYVRKK